MQPTHINTINAAIKMLWNGRVGRRMARRMGAAFLGLGAMSVAVCAHAQIVLTADQAAEVTATLDAANASSTPAFNMLLANTSRQAAASVQAASNVPKTYNTDLLQSGAVEQYAQAYGESHQSVMRGIGAEQMQRVKDTLPKLDQLGNDIKYGKFVVASDKGDEIISLIRALPTRSESERIAILQKIKNYSDRDYPEAVNFMGVIVEYGLFGVKPDMNRAIAFYKAAARRRYQPAIFNLANSAFYSKGGARQANEANQLIVQAYMLGNEASFRVCGLAAFISYRAGKQSEALSYGKACYSALANLPNAAYGSRFSLTERIKMLRDSISTGVDDGFNVLEQMTQKHGDDQDYLYCKYRLINQLRFTGRMENLHAMAKDCYQRTTRDLNSKAEQARAPMVLNGIAGFVPAEINALRQLRGTSHFHYAWSVPYLPFGQGEVDLFEPLMPKNKN